jgi:putrescine transport system permease protein
MRRPSVFLISMLAFGFAFLYVPILLLIIFSFNESRLVTVWGGFSLKWYAELFQNEQMLGAALVSLRVAVTSATIATVLGTMSALMMVRFGRFRGRLVFTGLITAPLVMPEVITGLSLLLMFVSLETLVGWPAGRGVDTITIAHTTFCMAYVNVVVQSRLAGLDRSVEEAAMDLGARPLKAFLVITLPMLAPALISGWLLSFTLSMDDLVIASFVAGPASTTLPMVVFSSVRLGVTPEINALATLLVLLATATILVAAAVLWRQERERDRAVARAVAEERGG